MSAIVSKIIREFWENLKFAHSYFKVLYPVNLFYLAFLLFFLNLTFEEYLVTVIVGFLSQLILLNYIGNYRRSEMKQLKSLLKNITKDRLQSPDEIKLNSSLGEIEHRLKAMFARTQQDIANLKKLEQVRTEFLGNVSHELRTPIFAIQGFLETLLNGAINDPKVNRNFVLKANNHTKNLNNLLNDLIDISMIESGQMRLSFNYFNIYNFLSKLVQEFKPMAEEKNLSLRLNCESQNLQLYGDVARLNQVMVNLVQNSIKYTEEGFVDIVVTEKQKYGIITVKDSGIGLSNKDLERIFERFYRVDKGRSKAVGGTGLGLAIVKHIVDAHDSAIDVKSRLNKGSEFSFQLKKKSH